MSLVVYGMEKMFAILLKIAGFVGSPELWLKGRVELIPVNHANGMVIAQNWEK
jgi:hypothetical protein